MGYKAFLFKEWVKNHVALVVIGSLAVVSTAIIVPVAVSKSKNKENNQTTQKQVVTDSQYIVTFRNYDGTYLGEAVVNEGESATYTGMTPSKPSVVSGNYRYDYTFTGWSPSTNNITSNTTATAQFSSTSTYIGSSSSSGYSSGSSSSSSSYVSDKQKVINHLNSYGSTEYHFVSTGTYSLLGYDSSSGKFVAGWSQTGSLTYTAVYLISYNASSGYGSLTIDYGTTTYFKAYSYVYISSHRYSSMSLDSVSVNLFPSSSSEDLAKMLLNTCQLSVNAATTYLINHSLPYIY